jgi:para-nitrobenzyl esterase
MKKIIKVQLVLCTILLLNFLVPVEAQEVRVKTVNGYISGSNTGDIFIFKGVPFAAPPVGDLRWKAPQPLQNWQGVKKCTEFSASPMQSKPVPFMMWTEEFIAPPEPLSEDCLYLNIWTSSDNSKKKLPVFVWIYGGGFTSGSSACAVYDGEEFAKKGMVFVSINYRVGVFGFLAHPELSRESENHVSGNYGILDQIEALKWIKANISQFGGDPGNVTIDGQSAGSMSVTALIASPVASGLFHRAIAQSGGLFSGRIAKKLNEAESQGVKLVEKLQQTSIAELRKLSATELMKQSAGAGMGSFAPIWDGYVLPSDPDKKFEINNVPIITGWVSGDASLARTGITSKDEFIKQAKEKYGTSAEEFLKIFPAETSEDIKQSQSTLGMLSFAGFPSHTLAIINKKATYIYQYTHVPPDKPDFPNYGAFHTSEVPYVLHTLHKWDRKWTSLDYQLEDNLSNYWVNFAKTGNPNGNGLPEWKTYDKQSGNILLIGDKIESIPALYRKELDFLDKFNPMAK